VGYSINDTVVVFDRLREYLGISKYKKEAMGETVNLAINRTLSRTVVTSLTVIFVLAVLFVFGGEVIRGFSFAILIGIIVATYSSVFLAAPMVVDLEGKKGLSEPTASDDKTSKASLKPAKA